MQPLVFELLLYLVRHRDRVVPKDELLDSVWSDTAVTEASLARAVSLARRAIGDGVRDAPFIRTHPRVGYRFTADVTEAGGAAAPADTQRSPSPAPPAEAARSPRPSRSAFARTVGGTHVAYQVMGDGPVDVVVATPWVMSIASVFDDAGFGAFFERLAGKARLILFDKRGTGLSDRVKELPGLAQRMEDLTAVLDAVGSKRAWLLGISEGAPMALLYAASHPGRVCGVALIGGFARMTRDVDQSFGWTVEDVDRLEAYIGERWGEGRSISTSVASRAEDAAFEAWAGRAELHGGSPGAALELWNMNRGIDVRDVLPLLHTPCLVLHSRRDAVISIEHGRDLAERIEGARLCELDCDDHMPFFGEAGDRTLEELEAWLGGPPAQPAARRRLATLLLVDGADSGDIEVEHAMSQVLAAHRGERVDAGGRVWGALFDGPALAARCASSIHASAVRHGASLRGALHCSEVECTEPIGEADAGEAPRARVSGPAVEEATRMLARVAPGETWTTESVKELSVGSGVDFAPRQGEASSAKPLYAIVTG